MMNSRKIVYAPVLTEGQRIEAQLVDISKSLFRIAEALEKKSIKRKKK